MSIVELNTAIRLTSALGITVEELVGTVFEADDEMYFEIDFVWFKRKEAGGVIPGFFYLLIISFFSLYCMFGVTRERITCIFNANICLY